VRLAENPVPERLSHADESRHSLVDLFDAIREGIERATLSAEQQRSAERAEHSPGQLHVA
jgi:hypothetical protein